MESNNNENVNNENIKFDGIVLDAKEFTLMFGNKKQIAQFNKYNSIRSQTTEKAIMRTAEQHYKIVEKRKYKNRNYYLLRKRRAKKIERERNVNRTYPDEFYEKKNVVYKIKNMTNGKIYIGSTETTLVVRIYRHKNSAKPNASNHERKIAQAFYRDNFKNFKFEILEQAENAEELRKIESYYILYFGSYENEKGYNSDVGKWVQIENIKDKVKGRK